MFKIALLQGWSITKWGGVYSAFKSLPSLSLINHKAFKIHEKVQNPSHQILHSIQYQTSNSS
jgi:hypothetical protein